MMVTWTSKMRFNSRCISFLTKQTDMYIYLFFNMYILAYICMYVQCMITASSKGVCLQPVTVMRKGGKRQNFSVRKAFLL